MRTRSLDATVIHHGPWVMVLMRHRKPSGLGPIVRYVSTEHELPDLLHPYLHPSNITSLHLISHLQSDTPIAIEHAYAHKQGTAHLETTRRRRSTKLIVRTADSSSKTTGAMESTARSGTSATWSAPIEAPVITVQGRVHASLGSTVPIVPRRRRIM